MPPDHDCGILGRMKSRLLVALFVATPALSQAQTKSLPQHIADDFITLFGSHPGYAAVIYFPLSVLLLSRSRPAAVIYFPLSVLLLSRSRPVVAVTLRPVANAAGPVPESVARRRP